MILRARFVVPITQPPIAEGCIDIHNGRIASVYPWIPKSGRVDFDLGNVALLPGLINAHTHLELTHLAGRHDPSIGFLKWIESLGREAKAANFDDEVIRESARRGMQLSLQAGVTAVGDITRSPELTRSVLTDGPLRTLSFGEVIAIGNIEHRAEARIAAARDTTYCSPSLRIGISPHAPYTVDVKVLRTIAERAAASALRCCIHVAETAEELEFTMGHRGPFRDFGERLGIWRPGIECPGCSPVEWLDRCGILNDAALLAHANYVSKADMDLIAKRGAHVVYCPRTHAAFGHAPHPFMQMRERGISVSLSTDSLASNPDLSVLNEARFVRSINSEVLSKHLLEMITVNPARALGLQRSAGRIEVGFPADFCAVPLKSTTASDPVEDILASSLDPIATWVSGRGILGHKRA